VRASVSRGRFVCHRDCHRAAKYHAKLGRTECSAWAANNQLEWALSYHSVSVGTPQVELQNRVHQFNSGRGLHLHSIELIKLSPDAPAAALSKSFSQGFRGLHSYRHAGGRKPHDRPCIPLPIQTRNRLVQTKGYNNSGLKPPRRCPIIVNKYTLVREYGVSFQIIILKLLAGHPEGRAAREDLRREIAIHRRPPAVA
jgi:hypothetical protein